MAYQNPNSVVGWKMPSNVRSRVRKEDLPPFFTTKSRDQWDYKRIDDTINAQSEFRKTEHRPQWESLRDDMGEEITGSTHTPSHYRLWHHFDEYVNMKDKRVAAAVAVKEQWNSENFYYPGEEFMQNRPGFRSVPKEILNKQTRYDYGSMEFFKKLQETMRHRPTVPHWPPPGYKMQPMNCKKQFEFGTDDPNLVSEVERYYWYTCWRFETNIRFGPDALLRLACTVFFFYYMMRDTATTVVKRAMENGFYYPGRFLMRPWGVPRDWNDENDHFWWQKPLDEFPCTGLIYWFSRHQFGMIHDENQRLRRASLGV